MVTAITMNYVEEAIGIAKAAERLAMPVAISFTVETVDNLPTGQTLREAVEQVDAATSRHPSYCMINCAHPTHFEHVLRRGESWTRRIRVPLRSRSSCSTGVCPADEMLTNSHFWAISGPDKALDK